MFQRGGGHAHLVGKIREGTALIHVGPNPHRGARTASQDNVYVGWDDFGNSDGIDGPDMRVAVSYGVNPPNFTVDTQTGNSLGFVNPGHRLATDPRTGFVYSMFQRCVSAPCPQATDPKNIDYMLNRSTDGGITWTLNGSATGIIVANANSTQPQPKFGTVNALLGGVVHGAVDPTTGDLYYVYGNRDAGTGNNRLAIRRIQDNGMGGVTVGPEMFVTGQVQAAIPVVAVASNGILGVFYYTFDGFSPGGFPTFTAHLSLSIDQGASFTDAVLLTFLSSATDNGDARQRVLGDYMQMKTVGRTFYGADRTWVQLAEAYPGVHRDPWDQPGSVGTAGSPDGLAVHRFRRERLAGRVTESRRLCLQETTRLKLQQGAREVNRPWRDRPRARRGRCLGSAARGPGAQ